MAPTRIVTRLPNWIGDAVMAWGALERLAEAAPDCEWILAAPPATRDLFTGVDEPFTLGTPWPRTGRAAEDVVVEALALRRARADLALIFPPSLASALAAMLAGVPRRVGWPTDARSILLTDVGPQPTRLRSLRVQQLELGTSALRAIGRDAPSVGAIDRPPRLPLRAEEIVRAEIGVREDGLTPGEFLVLAAGAVYGPTKRWPLEHFSAVAREWIRRGGGVAWFGGRDERAVSEELHASLPASARSRSRVWAGRHGLRESLARLALARAVVSNDSGAMHLAQAAAAPVVGIFGSTSPVWTGPIGPGARSVSRGASCAPCFRKSCPTQIECLGLLPPATVIAALDDLLASAAGRRGRPALFVDRDGTLLELVPYLSRPELVRLIPGAATALRRAREAGWAIVVVTNQSAVARGRLSARGLHDVHLRMRELLAREGVELDGVEYCPHHPEITGPCACRKPSPGLLRRAAHRHDLDLARSILIGDAESDLGAAEAAGIPGILVETGYGRETSASRPEAPHFADLAGAVEAVLAGMPADRAVSR